MNLKGNWLTLLQLIFSLLAAGVLFTLAASMALLGVVSWLLNLPEGISAGDASLFTGVVSFSFCALVLLPSGYLALQRLRGKAEPVLPEKVKPLLGGTLLALLIFVLPASLGIGWLASRHPASTALVLPVMHLLAIGIPMLWLATIGLRGLPVGSQQRAWGVFGAGLVLGPSIIISLEIFAFLVFAISAGIILSMDPARMAQVEALTSALRSTITPDEMLSLVTPILTHPAVAAAIFTFMAVIVPLIEETFKPIGLYLLLGHRLTPIEGFAAGLLSGAGFGLFESLLLTTSGTAWVGVVIARAGTGAVHMLTAGLTGYGLASALGERRYLRLLGCFAAAVFIHGLWNGLTVVVAGASLLENTGSAVQPLVQAVPFMLASLGLLCFLFLVGLNHRFKRTLEA